MRWLRYCCLGFIRSRTLSSALRTPSAAASTPSVAAASWNELREVRTESRARGVEGLMLKRLASPYRVGRQRGDWWKWKIEPFTVDAVLIYAQRGHGRRASLYTDYTFAVWDGDQLTPFAKARSGKFGTGKSLVFVRHSCIRQSMGTCT